MSATVLSWCQGMFPMHCRHCFTLILPLSTRITEADPFCICILKYLINMKRNWIWNACGGHWMKGLNKRPSVSISHFWLRCVGGFGAWGDILTCFNFCLCSKVSSWGGGLSPQLLLFEFFSPRTRKKLLWNWQHSACACDILNTHDKELKLETGGPQLDHSLWKKF